MAKPSRKLSTFGPGVPHESDSILRVRKGVARQFLFEAPATSVGIGNGDIEDIEYITIALYLPPRHEKFTPIVTGIIKTDAWHTINEIRTKLVPDGVVKKVNRKTTQKLVGLPFAVPYARPDSGMTQDSPDEVVRKLFN